MPQERHGPRRAEFLGLEVPRPRSQEQRVPRAITLGMESCRGLADLCKRAIGSRLGGFELVQHRRDGHRKRAKTSSGMNGWQRKVCGSLFTMTARR